MTTSSDGGNHSPAWPPGSGWGKGFEKPWGKGFENQPARWGKGFGKSHTHRSDWSWCLDDTWAGAYDEAKRRDGHTVLKPANPLRMCRAVVPFDEATGRMRIAYYHIGVGALARSEFAQSG